MKKILITGAWFYRFTSRRVIRQKGFEVIAFDRYNSNNPGLVRTLKFKNEIEVVLGDIQIMTLYQQLKNVK